MPVPSLSGDGQGGAGGGRRKFPRSVRISDPRVFREAFASKYHRAGRLMVVWFRYAPDAEGRLGVIASKRTFRRAVDRNRAKRLLREAYRLNRRRFSNKYDLVVVARRRILDVARKEVEREMCKLAFMNRTRECRQV